LVKRGKEDELLRERTLKLSEPDSSIFKIVKNTVLEIAKSKEFRRYIKKAAFAEEWEIADALQSAIVDSTYEVIYKNSFQVRPIKEGEEFYNYVSNFEILAACGRFDLIDREVEDKCKMYADLAIFDDITKEEVLNNIKQHLAYIEKIKEELRKKYGGGDDA